MLPIGEFSKICNVTTKTLRYYDEIGLVKPAIISEHNGYRFYEVNQLQTVLLINKLKKYCFSLEEIEDVLRDIGNEKLSRLIRQKQRLLQEKLEHDKYILAQLTEDIHNLERGIPIMAYLDRIQVSLVETEPKNIVFTRQKMSIDEYDKYFGKLFQIIAKEHLTCIGAPIAIYHDEEFDPTSNDTEIAIPVAERTPGTRQLNGSLCAKGVHKGPYSELPSTYTKIAQWIESEGYKVISSPYEIYVTDPSVVKPEDNITEIYFPVRKDSAGAKSF